MGQGVQLWCANIRSGGHLREMVLVMQSAQDRPGAGSVRSRRGGDSNGIVRSRKLLVADPRRHHGYQPSPGTLYPMLHGLKWKGHLAFAHTRNGKVGRRVYRITRRRRRTLAAPKRKVRELFGELFQESSEEKRSWN